MTMAIQIVHDIWVNSFHGGEAGADLTPSVANENRPTTVRLKTTLTRRKNFVIVTKNRKFNRKGIKRDQFCTGFK